MSLLGAIAHPVRLAIVRRLAERSGASLADLATAAGVHANTVRPHVAALEEAGVLTREFRPAEGRGRPGVRYRLTESVAFSPAGFLGLAELLAAALVRLTPSPEELRAVGRNWGRYLLGRPRLHDLGSDLPRVLERLGFEAHMEKDVVLLNCPCPLVAPDQPELVCELAAGVVEGVAEVADGGSRLGWRRHDPVRRNCRLSLSKRRSSL